MYWYKKIFIDKNISKSEQNKELHEAAFSLLEEKLIKKFHFKKEDLKYKYGLRGKPYLENSPFYFSISHCNNIVVCIISKRNVGIDIEDIKEVNKFVVKKSLTELELSKLVSLNSKEEYFFRIWTLKEALLKVKGFGLSYGMKNIEFYINDKILSNNKREENISCNLNGFSFNQEKIKIDDKEYIISVAWEDNYEQY